MIDMFWGPYKVRDQIQQSRHSDEGVVLLSVSVLALFSIVLFRFFKNIFRIHKLYISSNLVITIQCYAFDIPVFIMSHLWSTLTSKIDPMMSTRKSYLMEV
ncbi:MAG: hypothetical protein ACI8RD_011991 [Bacillariaceae sp.]|jgi:hypothetical protein